MTYNDSNAVAPPLYCSMCGKLEHGSSLCKTITFSDTSDIVDFGPKAVIRWTAKAAVFGLLVHCLNCGILWRRVTEFDNPGGTVPSVDVQYNCPKCGSNAYEIEPPKQSKSSEKEEIKRLEERLREVEDELLRERLNRINKAAGFPDNTIGV